MIRQKLEENLKITEQKLDWIYCLISNGTSSNQQAIKDNECDKLVTERLAQIERSNTRRFNALAEQLRDVRNKISKDILEIKDLLTYIDISCIGKIIKNQDKCLKDN